MGFLCRRPVWGGAANETKKAKGYEAFVFGRCDSTYFCLRRAPGEDIILPAEASGPGVRYRIHQRKSSQSFPKGRYSPSISLARLADGPRSWCIRYEGTLATRGPVSSHSESAHAESARAHGATAADGWHATVRSLCQRNSLAACCEVL